MHAAVLGMQDSDSLGWNKNLPFLATQCSGWDTWTPSMLATLGYVDEASVARHIPFRPDFTLSRVLKNQQPFPLSGRTFDEYWKACWDQHLTSPRGARTAISPRLLTCHKTARHPSTDGNSPFFMSDLTTLVVSDSPDDVANLCLYWNLAPWVSDHRGLALLVPQSELLRPEVLARVQSPIGSRPFLFLVSMTQTTDQLTRLAALLPGGSPRVLVSGADDSPRDWLLGSSVRYGVSSTFTSTRRTDRYPILPAQNDFLEACPREHMTMIAREYSVSGIRMPRILRPVDGLERARVFGTSRLHPNDDGFVEQGPVQPNHGDLTELRVPAGWSLLESIFASVGCRITRSNHGQRISGLYRLLGSLESLRAIAIPEIRELVEAFAAESDHILPHGEVTKWLCHGKTLDRLLAGRMVNWMAYRRLLLRGIMASCPQCGFSQFVPSTGISNELVCAGCTAASPFPLRHDIASWYYRCNEMLLQEAAQQGALVPAAAFGYLCRYRASNVLAHFPGVEIQFGPDLASRLGRPSMEVDYVFVSTAGEVFVCECKQSGRTLTAQEICELVTLASALRGVAVVATWHDFDECFFSSADTCAILASLESAELDCLTADEILNPFPEYHEESRMYSSPEEEAAYDAPERRTAVVRAAIDRVLQRDGFLG